MTTCCSQYALTEAQGQATGWRRALLTLLGGCGARRGLGFCPRVNMGREGAAAVENRTQGSARTRHVKRRGIHHTLSARPPQRQQSRQTKADTLATGTKKPPPRYAARTVPAIREQYVRHHRGRAAPQCRPPPQTHTPRLHAQHGKQGTSTPPARPRSQRTLPPPAPARTPRTPTRRGGGPPGSPRQRPWPQTAAWSRRTWAPTSTKRGSQSPERASTSPLAERKAKGWRRARPVERPTGGGEGSATVPAGRGGKRHGPTRC